MVGFLSKSSLVAAAVFLSVAAALSIFFASSSPKLQTTVETDIFGVKIIKNPPQSKLTDLGVSSWRKWEGGPSKFPWTFTATETMYLLKGKVKVECEGHEGQFEIGAGDLVVFPNGMKVTWDIIEPVEKHFSLEE
ncbi:unnamed protein product [Rhodiola kirilowii]